MAHYSVLELLLNLTMYIMCLCDIVFEKNVNVLFLICFFTQPEKGLIHLQNCSRTTNSRCGCQPGMYCIRGFNNPYCSYCTRYKACKAGFGVALPGKECFLDIMFSMNVFDFYYYYYLHEKIH